VNLVKKLHSQAKVMSIKTYIGIQICRPMLLDMTNTFMFFATSENHVLVGIFHFKKLSLRGDGSLIVNLT
jgi:hypothetical protein